MSRPNPPPTTNIVHPEVWRGSARYWRIFTPTTSFSKRRMRKAESIECVRLNREGARQNLGFSSRPFVLCGLPVKRPASGCLLHERQNGQFVLQVTVHPS
jgi:hypothetical protein